MALIGVAFREPDKFGVAVDIELNCSCASRIKRGCHVTTWCDLAFQAHIAAFFLLYQRFRISCTFFFLKKRLGYQVGVLKNP